MCVSLTSLTLKLHSKLHSNYTHHAQTSLFDDCAGGSLTDKIRAKYEQLDSVSLGHLAPQHFMRKPVNWLIYFLL